MYMCMCLRYVCRDMYNDSITIVLSECNFLYRCFH